MGEVRRAADIPAGVAGRTAKFTAFVLDADMLAFLRKGASEALGRQQDSSRDFPTLSKQGMSILLRVSRMRDYNLGAVDFGEDPSKTARGSAVPAS